MKKSTAKRLFTFFLAFVVIASLYPISIKAYDDGAQMVWNYDDPGTGMPDPNDPNEGLPFPNSEEAGITHYSFDYVSKLLNYEKTAEASSAKAGDVIWLNISVRNIDVQNNPYGLFCFEGTVAFDVEHLTPFCFDVESGADRPWFNAFTTLDTTKGDLNYRIYPTVQAAPYFTKVRPCPSTSNLPKYRRGYGLHWYTTINGINHQDPEAKAVTEDDCFMMCLPIKLNDDLEEGQEYTFTLPYPTYHLLGTPYVDRPDDLYGRGGACTIRVDNHDSVNDNLAHYAAYASALAGEAFGEKGTGFLNDLRYPLTERSDYEKFAGSAKVDMQLQSPSRVNSVKVTFNDTAETELPQNVKVYGVKADGTKELLGTAADGTAYYSGIVDTQYNEKNLSPDPSVTVNAANAYMYTVSGFTPAIYTGIYVEADAAAGASLAMGEIEVNGAETYRLTVENGSGSGNYEERETVKVKADDHSANDEHFVRWNVVSGQIGIPEGQETSEETTVTVYMDATIRAEYVANEYRLTVENGTGSGDYVKNTRVNVKADAPEPEMVFDKWVLVSGDAQIEAPESAETVVTTNGVATVRATYKPILYTLTVENGTGSGDYAKNSRVNIKANAPENADMVFDKWILASGDAQIEAPENAETVVTTNGVATVRATYKPRQYSLTVENGTGSGDYVKNTRVNVKADAPEPEMVFDKWILISGDAQIEAPENAETVVTTNGVATVRATYKPILYTLTVENGTGSGDYAKNTKVDIKANAPENAEMVFDKWILVSGDAQIEASENPETVVTTNGVATVRATYKPRQYSLTVENGTGSGDYVKNTRVNVKANAPEPDMEFDKWILISGDAQIEAPENAETVVTTNGVATVRATYKPILYTLTVENGTGSGDYAKNTKVDIKANAPENAEMVFDKWILVSGDAQIEASENPEAVVTTNGVATVRATYKPRQYSLTVENGTGSGDYAKNTKVDIKANAPEPDMVFDKWVLVSGDAQIEAPENAETVVTTNGVATVRATYKPILYTLTVENGTGSGDYAKNTKVEIEANAPENSGKVFDKWVVVSGNASIEDADSAKTTVTTDGAATVRATYREQSTPVTGDKGVAMLTLSVLGSLLGLAVLTLAKKRSKAQ